jgi:hypothetical protein
MASEYIYTVVVNEAGPKTFTMPVGFETSVEIHAWGAGGGLGRGGLATPGGGGGYAKTVATIEAGDEVTLSVGQPGTNGSYPFGGTGGLSWIGRRYGGGNSAEAWDEDHDSGAGGGGGGASFVAVAGSVVVAGAGGGGASGVGEDFSGRQAGKPGGSWNSLVSSGTRGGDALRASASGGGGGGGYPKGGAAGYGVADDNYAGPQAGSGGQNYGDTTEAGSGALPGGRTSPYYPGASRGKSTYPGYIVMVFTRKFNASVKDPEDTGSGWINLDAAYTKVAGSWKLIQQAFTKVEGEWKSILSTNAVPILEYIPDRVTINHTINANTSDYRLINTISADPTYIEGYTDIVVTVDTGVVIRGQNTTTAFGIAGFYTGDTILLINDGTIAGRGGRGGRGAYTYTQSKSVATANATIGGRGGNGLVAEHNVTLINNNIIQAGGGGGGGGGLARTSNKSSSSYTNGGQGGGGAAYGVGANNGTLSAGGAGQTVSGAGDGGAGGAPGAKGSTGVSSSSAGAAGGNPGWAILGADKITFSTVGTITGSSGIVRSGAIDVYRVV